MLRRCSRRPVGDANQMQFQHAGASHSEAATAAYGIAALTRYLLRFKRYWDRDCAAARLAIDALP